MHYTEGARTSTIAPFGTINQHVNQNLPTTGGSTVSAEFLNALMFEVANAITFAGLSIEADSATDRANGFAQLAEAIFESGAIDTDALADGAVTSAKVDEVSLTKLSAGSTDIDFVSGDLTYHLDLDAGNTSSLVRCIMTDAGASTVDQTYLRHDGIVITDILSTVTRNTHTLASTGILIREYSAAAVETGRAGLAVSGLSFLSSGKTIKHKACSAAGLTYVYDEVLGDYYITVTTSIPEAAVILMAQYSYTGPTWRVVDNAATIHFYISSGYWKARVRYDDDPAYIDSDEWLTIIYSDS